MILCITTRMKTLPLSCYWPQLMTLVIWFQVSGNKLLVINWPSSLSCVVATCISEDIQTTTLVQFLTETKVVIEAWAEQIHQGYILPSWIHYSGIWLSISTGTAVIEDRTMEEIANIKKEAACIVHTGWVPGHFMIDKSLVEKHVIQRGNTAVCLF